MIKKKYLNFDLTFIQTMTRLYTKMILQKQLLISICLLCVGGYFSSCNNDNNNQPKVTETVTDSIATSTPDSFYTVIDFLSEDSLMIRGHWYHQHDTATTILLCHQARFNKYEYDSIAIVLFKKGYNCLAIDQRSGGMIGDSSKGWYNKTYERAIAAQKPTTYLDAEQDIRAAIDFLYQKYQRPIILWGSSYSATLALYNGLDNEKVKAVIAFSPGDYFEEDSREFSTVLAQKEKPFWITSSKEESLEIAQLLKSTHLDERQVHFIPTSDGRHGSKALMWSSQANHTEYWQSLMNFLNNI